MWTAYQEVKYIKDSSERKCKATNIIWKVSQEARCCKKKKKNLYCLTFWGLMGATERQKDAVNIIKQHGRPQMPLLFLRTTSCWTAVVLIKPHKCHICLNMESMWKIKAIYKFIFFITFGNQRCSVVAQDPDGRMS